MEKNVIIKGIALVTHKVSKEIQIDIPFSTSKENLEELEIYNKEDLKTIVTEFVDYDFYPEENLTDDLDEEIISIEILNLSEVLEELEELIPEKPNENCCDIYRDSSYNYCPTCGTKL